MISIAVCTARLLFAEVEKKRIQTDLNNFCYINVILPFVHRSDVFTVVAHMLVTARKNYSVIYAYAVSFIECIDTHN